jgi:hypothetical protein
MAGSYYPYMMMQDIGRQGQDNPWYNPYSKYPDLAGGMRDLANRIWQIREMKRQQKLEEEQRAERKKQTALENQRYEKEHRWDTLKMLAGMGQAASPNEWEARNRQIDTLVAQGVITPEEGTGWKAGAVPQGFQKQPSTEIPPGQQAQMALTKQRWGIEDMRSYRAAKSLINKTWDREIAKEAAAFEDNRLKITGNRKKLSGDQARQIEYEKTGLNNKVNLFNQQRKDELASLDEEWGDVIKQKKIPQKAVAQTAGKLPLFNGFAGDIPEAALKPGTEIYDLKGEEGVVVNGKWLRVIQTK